MKQQFAAKHPWTILAAGAAIQVLTGLPAAWGVFQQPVMEEYGLSEQGAGYAFALLIASFGVGCVLGGFLQDKKGPRCAALWGTALLCGGFFYSQLSLYRPRQAKCCLLLLTAAALLPYTPEHLPVCAILHTLLALAAALLFLYNLFYLSLQLYLSSPAPARYSQTPSNTAFFSKLTHSLDSPAARGRLCLLLLWTSCVFCLDSWILSGIINSAMEICLTLTAGVLFWLFFPSLRLASNHPHSLL